MDFIREYLAAADSPTRGHVSLPSLFLDAVLRLGFASVPFPDSITIRTFGEGALVSAEPLRRFRVDVPTDDAYDVLRVLYLRGRGLASDFLQAVRERYSGQCLVEARNGRLEPTLLMTDGHIGAALEYGFIVEPGHASSQTGEAREREAREAYEAYEGARRVYEAVEAERRVRTAAARRTVVQYAAKAAAASAGVEAAKAGVVATGYAVNGS
jgi:hypothetical protein